MPINRGRAVDDLGHHLFGREARPQRAVGRIGWNGREIEKAVARGIQKCDLDAAGDVGVNPRFPLVAQLRSIAHHAAPARYRERGHAAQLGCLGAGAVAIRRTRLPVYMLGRQHFIQGVCRDHIQAVLDLCHLFVCLEHQIIRPSPMVRMPEPNVHVAPAIPASAVPFFQAFGKI